MNEPKPSPLRKRLVLGGAVLLSLVLTLVIGNAVLAARRTLHVINGTPAPLKVEVGGASVEVAPGEHATLTLAEGEHEARFGESTLRFTIEGSFFERSLGGSAFVLNPYAAAALRWEEGTFGPRAGEGRPERILLGSFHTFRSVDLPFQPFPAQSAVPALTRVDYALGKSGVILGESVPTAGSLDYAEYHLWRSSGSTLLAAYLDRARKLKARARARTFLADGLEREPLDVPWHRSYQDLARRELGRAELERTYGVRSAAAPQSAPLRYLLGRQAPSPAAAWAHYEAALKLDPACAWAHYGLSVHALRRGRFALAREHIGAARKAAPEERAFESVWIQARFLVGELKALEAELRTRSKERPTELATQRYLLETLAAQGKTSELREAQTRYRRAILGRSPDDPSQLVLLSELLLQGIQGDAKGLVAKSQGVKDTRLRARFRFQAAMFQGDPKAALTALRARKGDPNLAWDWLLFALSSSGPEAQARWTEARERLAKGSGAMRQVAKLLEAPQALAGLRPLALQPAHKASALLAWIHLQNPPPPTRQAALDLAARLNAWRVFPRSLLEAAHKRLSAP